MQEKQAFSLRTLSLSVAAAELGRAILGTGQGRALRTELLTGLLAAVILVLFSELARVNSSRLNSAGPAARCIRSVFLLWYLAELARTAVMIQTLCWEQFSSLAFVGLLPLFFWAGWGLECGQFDRASGVLWWLLLLGAVFCIVGLAGQLHWQNLAAGESAGGSLPDAVILPEYFSFPVLCRGKNSAVSRRKSGVALPVISLLISSGYGLGLGLLFGAPQQTERPGYELLRAWNFGGISRFDAAFLLIWLAAAIFRFCFLLRAVHLLALTLRPKPSGAEAAG